MDPLGKACVMGSNAESEAAENSDMLRGMVYAPLAEITPHERFRMRYIYIYR